MRRTQRLLFAILVVAPPASAFEDSPAERLRRDVEIARQTTHGDEVEEISLPMDEVFAQGSTQWCWAYAAFHTLRTYYMFSLVADQVMQEWRWSLDDINDAQKFRTFMGKRVSTGTRGYPEYFLKYLKDTSGNALPTQHWQSFTPNGYDAFNVLGGFLMFRPTQTTSRANVTQRLHTNLANGVASAWCGRGHCITIYGGDFVDGKAKSYEVADSGSSKLTYTADGPELDRYMASIFTLAGE